MKLKYVFKKEIKLFNDIDCKYINSNNSLIKSLLFYQIVEIKKEKLKYHFLEISYFNGYNIKMFDSDQSEIDYEKLTYEEANEIIMKIYFLNELREEKLNKLLSIK